MSFTTDETVWREFLAAWPIERLRNMSLAEYTTVGDKDCFTYWLESRLEKYGSIWGGSAFKFGVYARRDTTDKAIKEGLAYDARYGWYAKFGDTAEAAFTAVRGHVVAVAEAARAGRLADIDKSPLGAAYRWKIAFHYQPLQDPTIVSIFTRKTLLHVLGRDLSDVSTPLSELYQAIAERRPPGESIMAFGENLWREWVQSSPFVVKLSAGAIRNGNLAFSLSAAPFPEAMYGGLTDADLGERAVFHTDTGDTFESDIRVEGDGGTGRLRKRLGQYFQAIQAEPGDSVKIAPQSDGSYRLSLAARGPSSTRTQGNPTTNQSPSQSVQPMPPLNQILYGPPGTGKTYETIRKALEILDPAFLSQHDASNERKTLKQRFDALLQEGVVQFVTFHQSFSYEDFVEGLRADTDKGSVRYDVADGVFKRLCDAARARKVEGAGTIVDSAKRRVWKLSLGDAATEGHIFDECMEKGIALIGFGEGADFSDCKTHADIRNRLKQAVGQDVKKGDYGFKALHMFVLQMKPGDLVIVSEGNFKLRAIGEIVGEYRHLDRQDDDYSQSRAVRWLRIYKPALPYEALLTNRFSQMTLYEPRQGSIDRNKLQALLGESTAKELDQPHVLIIDEINRGNVARIFGELITLIERSKREGADEALKVRLPYSQEEFTVPQNVFLIGTMNTADRSLTGLDTALRRRFEFIEMPPRPDLLAGKVVAGVDLQLLLETINRRIELLLDREHRIGHAYFMSLSSGPDLAPLASVFRNQVVPLLQEYFFEDWKRIHWVLNDHRKPPGLRFVVPSTQSPKSLFGDDEGVPTESRTWQLDALAFERVDSYLGISST